MTDPDIRVRLSPEGVAEVVNALKQIRRESRGAAGGAAREIGLLSEVSKELKSLLPTLGFAGVVYGLISLGRHALETGEQIRKMSQKVGASVEDLSTLRFQMLTTDVSAEQLEKGMVQLAKNIIELRDGNEKVTESFEELGLSVADFTGKNTGEAFILVATAIGKMPAGIEKAAAAFEHFGKGGSAMIPLLNEIATKGFAQVRKEAEAAGLVMSNEFTKAAEEANDSIKLMKAQSESLAIAFMTGFVGPLTEAVDEFRSATAGGEGLKDLGAAVGEFFLFVTRGFLIAGATIAAFVALVEDKARNLKQTLQDIAGGVAKGALRGGPGGAIAGGIAALTKPSEGASRQAEIIDELGRKIEEILKTTDPKKLAEHKKAVDALLAGDEAGEAKSLATKDRIAALGRKIRDDELKQLAELAKAGEATNDRLILAERKLADARASARADTTDGAKAISDAEHAVNRARIQAAQETADREIAIITLRTNALVNAARVQGLGEKETAQTIKEIHRQGAEQRLAVNVKLHQDLTRLQDAELARARAAAQTIIALDKEVANNKRELQKFSDDITLAGLSEEQKVQFTIMRANAATSELRDAALSGNLEKARELRGEVTGLARDVEKLGASRAAERIFEDANDLFKMAADARKLQASAAGDVATKEAERLGAQLQTIKETIGEQANEIVANIKPRVDQEALRTLIDTIRETLQSQKFTVQVYPQMVGGPALIGQPGVAEGGTIPGWSPTPKADNVLIRATAGEFMQPVRAVRHYGTDFMEAIRTLQFPRFAEGGSVGGGSFGGGGPDKIVEIRAPSGRSARGSFSSADVRELIEVLRESDLGDGGE